MRAAGLTVALMTTRAWMSNCFPLRRSSTRAPITCPSAFWMVKSQATSMHDGSVACIKHTCMHAPQLTPCKESPCINRSCPSDPFDLQVQWCTQLPHAPASAANSSHSTAAIKPTRVSVQHTSTTSLLVQLCYPTSYLDELPALHIVGHCCTRSGG